MSSKRNNTPKIGDRTWTVRVRYVVEGTVTVVAGDGPEAESLALDEMTCPPTCEVVDWTASNPTPEVRR